MYGRTHRSGSCDDDLALLLPVYTMIVKLVGSRRQEKASTSWLLAVDPILLPWLYRCSQLDDGFVAHLRVDVNYNKDGGFAANLGKVTHRRLQKYRRRCLILTYSIDHEALVCVLYGFWSASFRTIKVSYVTPDGGMNTESEFDMHSGNLTFALSPSALDTCAIDGSSAAKSDRGTFDLQDRKYT